MEKQIEQSTTELKLQIIASNANISYQNNVVLDNINFNFRTKDCVTIYGENGSGKTTLIKLIIGLKHIKSGKFFSNIQSKNIGYVSTNERSFYWRLSVINNLKFFGSLKGLSIEEIKKNIEIYESYLDIQDILDKKYMELSSGQKKKSFICTCSPSRTPIAYNGRAINKS